MQGGSVGGKKGGRGKRGIEGKREKEGNRPALEYFAVGETSQKFSSPS